MLEWLRLDEATDAAASKAVEDAGKKVVSGGSGAGRLGAL
jgi:hypothetical protein